MKLSETNILEILSGQVQFVLPVYQRHYSWEKEQCVQLWKDIVRMVKNPAVVGNNHFIGSIVNIKDNGGGSKFTLIDGQQRMATLTLILTVLRDYARRNTNSGIDAAEIENNYLQNKLILNGEDKKVLKKLIDGNFDFAARQNSNDDEDDVTLPKLAENYKFFKRKLELRNPELTPKQVYEALGKLKIVNITLYDDDDNPQVIFESLNSSGKDLSKSDLIRNFMLMGLDQKTMNKIYRNYWAPMEELFSNNSVLMDNFFKDYLTLWGTKIPAEEEVYEKFKSWFYTARKSSEIPDLCNDIYQKAKDYANIKFARHDNPSLQAVYAEIKELKMEVSYPFLLKIHADFRQGLISEDELIKIMFMCISYVVRRDICGLSSASLNQTFAGLKRSIDTKHYVSSVKEAFSMMSGLQRFPDDTEFANAFSSCKLYGRNRAKYILGLLENFDRDDPINPRLFKIERVMPEALFASWQQELGANYQDIHAKYLDTTANLTLVENDLEINNNSFINTKNSLRQSNLKLNSYICGQNNWKQETIVNRKNYLTQKAKQIWAMNGREKIVAVNLPPLNVSEIAERLDMRINELSPHEITRHNIQDYEYRGIQYKIRGENVAAVVKQTIQVKIYPNINFHEVNDLIAQLQGRHQSVTHYVHTLGNGNIKIVLPGIRTDVRNPQTPQNCATDDDVDIVFEIIKKAFERARRS